MAGKNRKTISAGVTELMGDNPDTNFTRTRKSGSPVSRKPASPISREKGKSALRKLTVDVPENVHDEYEQLYLEISAQYLKQNRKKLKRVEYAPLVLKYGLDRKRISQALASA